MKEVILVIVCFSLIALSSGAVNTKALSICLMVTSLLVAFSMFADRKHELITQKRLKHKKLKKIINNYQKKA